MADRSRVRLGLTVDGLETELLSIRDRGSNGLVITRRPMRLFWDGDRSPRELIDQHYSIHPSNDGRDLCVTQKTVLADQSRVSLAGFIRGDGSTMISPVVAARLASRDPGRPRFQPPPRHEYIDAGAYETDRSSCFYSVFVADLDFDPSCVTTTALKMFVIRQTRYVVIVLLSFLDVPSPPDGKVLPFITSPPRTDGDEVFDDLQIDVGPIPAGGLTRVHWGMMKQLADDFSASLEDVRMSLQPASRQLLDLALDRWTAEPGKVLLHPHR